MMFSFQGNLGDIGEDGFDSWRVPMNIALIIRGVVLIENGSGYGYKIQDFLYSGLETLLINII